MTRHLWLRAEQKRGEQRSALVPDVARQLLDSGFQISVERCTQRAIPDTAFADVGCSLVPTASWPQAPDDAWILGLKELPDSDLALHHKHIYFAHAYKNQVGWQQLLGRFNAGGGKLYDIEYLVDEQNRRVAAFGYWAGFAGAALALSTWAGQVLNRQPSLQPVSAYVDKQTLLASLKADLEIAIDQAGRVPEVVVIGALGRSGQGAVECIEACNCRLLAWDIAETRAGGPFPELLNRDIFVNCVFVNQPVEPFLTLELLLQPDRQLSVICDVSCDPGGPLNPLPIYERCTTFELPLLSVIESTTNLPALDLIAIDHLPSLLPAESSQDFAAQLAPYLAMLDAGDGQGHPDTVWSRSLAVFHDKASLA